MSLSPEVLAEQVMGYVVWASELIPTLKPSSQKTYSVAILPQGPHFYTGLLQAAGYLLLDNRKKKLLIISQQADNPKDILIDTTNYWPVFWKNWKNSTTKITKLAHDIGAKISTSGQKSLSEQIHFQLPFLRVITTCDDLIHISIGWNISQKSINTICVWIKKNIQDYNIVIVSNIEIDKPATSKKIDEQNKIAKIIQNTSQKTPLLTLFQKIITIQKGKSEIIAYVNPSDFAKTASLTTRYICAVG